MSSSFGRQEQTNKFVRHIPCPKCGSRDNLGEWSDGHQWCFGCGYYQPAERTVANSRPSIEEQSERDSNTIIDNCSTDIPEKPLKWLKQYGVTDEEIQSNGICWNVARCLLLFRIQAQTGPAYVGRSFDSGPKYVSFGPKPQLSIFGKGGGSGCLIFVEDILSAIKVGRQYAACPVLGSHISLESLKIASERFSEVGVWLDSDMVRKASRLVLRASGLGIKVFRVYSEQDPKCYSDEEIKEIVEKVRNL